VLIVRCESAIYLQNPLALFLPAYLLSKMFFMRKNSKKKEIQRLREAAKEIALQTVEL